MRAGRIHRVHRVHARKHRRNQRARDLVNEGAENTVLLRRPADHGERPDGVPAVVDAAHAQHGKTVCQAVIAQVIAERPLGLAYVRIHICQQAEVGVHVHRQRPPFLLRQPHTSAAERARERQLGHAFG